MKLKFGILVSCLLIWSGQLAASSPQLSGSSVTSFLGYKTESAHTNFFQQVTLGYRPKAAKNISVHVNLMGLTDLGPEKVKTPFQVYGAYVDWNRLLKNHVDLSLGRKFYFNGVGVGYLDGAFLSIRPAKKVSVAIFGGVEVPYDRSAKIYRLQDGYIFGGKIEAKRILGTRLGVSFYQKVRSNSAYWQLVGMNVSRAFGRSIFWNTRVSFNLLESTLQKALVNLRWLPTSKLLFYVEGFYRKPHIYHDSFFQRFELNALTQGRFNTVYYFSKKYGLTGDLLWIQSEEKQAQKIRLGVLTPYGIIGFQQDLGAAGFQTRLYADASYVLTSGLKARLLLDFSNYQISDWSESYIQVGSAFRLDYQINKKFLVALEDQFNNNRLYKVDNRILGQVLCRF